MAAYRKLVEDVIALGGQVGVKLRYWSAWNEPNHPFFISPQRATCDASAPSLAVKRYAEITRNLKRALDDAPGDQQYVLGELAGLDTSKSREHVDPGVPARAADADRVRLDRDLPARLRQRHQPRAARHQGRRDATTASRSTWCG